MTNAGRSNEAQTFTYIPDSGTAALSKRTPILIKRSHFYCRAENIDPWVFQIFPSVDNSESQAVKTEEPSLLEPCIFDSQPKSISSEQSDCSGQSSKRQEDTPMEVSSNQTPTDIFKVAFLSFRRMESPHSTSIGVDIILLLFAGPSGPFGLSPADPGTQLQSSFRRRVISESTASTA